MKRPLYTENPAAWDRAARQGADYSQYYAGSYYRPARNSASKYLYVIGAVVIAALVLMLAS